MKKIIFVINNLETGGVQNSLLNLIQEIHDLYDVTVLVFHYKENYEKLLPSNVHLLFTKEPFSYLGMSQRDAKERNIHIFRACWVVFTRIFGRSNAIRLMSLRCKQFGEFDCAISFLHEGTQKMLYGGCNEYVLNNIFAKEKIAWIHCDFKLCGANTKQSKRIYKKFDKIIACSDGAKEAFVKCIPEFEYKCYAIRNCNNYPKIKQLASSVIEYNKDDFNIVTVARLSEEKGIDRALLAIKECVEKGYNIKYHIIGYGSQEEKLKKLVSDLRLKEYVVFYGKKDNPYSYIANADLFMLTSYHEAAPMVFDEAASLGVPVMATETTSTQEMILKNKSGYVCENSQDGITNMLLAILNNREELNKIKESLGKRIFNNKKIVDTFVKVI